MSFNTNSLIVVAETPEQALLAETYAATLGVSCASGSEDQTQHPAVWLRVGATALSLTLTACKPPVHFTLDFVRGSYAHREKSAAKKTSPLARAIGLCGKSPPATIVDATGGLGRDAALLAYWGCDVLLLERSLVMVTLLNEALTRAAAAHIPWVPRLTVRLCEAQGYLAAGALVSPDVVYLDPMYPERVKAAKPKKEMQIVRALVGEDADADELLPLALAFGARRVVVKRPRHAPPLAHIPPSWVCEGERCRFDVYV